MPWNQFLMKNLLESEVCGTHEQCTGALFTAKKSKHAAREKKKKKERKKERNTNVDPQTRFADPNGYLKCNGLK